MADPSTTGWISALSTAALGILGLFITARQWRLTKFRPNLKARIDAKREAIELLIVNKGRASGIIDQVDVLLPDDRIDHGANFEGFPEGTFRPLALPALASMRLIIQAPSDHVFNDGVQLLVGIGKIKPMIVAPTRVTEGVGLFGLKSVLPPRGLT